MSAVLEAIEIWCKYPRSPGPVLKGVSLRVEEGEFVGIVGPNGSGKTTLLRALSGTLKPFKGSVLLDGRDIYKMSPKEIARRIGVVSQDSYFSFPFTAFEVVLMGRSPYLKRFEWEKERDKEMARKALALTDALHLASRRIDELSGGERQRVMIARAIAQETKVLLLDEPGSSLDINHQVELYELLLLLNEAEGKTVVMISHDINMASRYCKRIIVMDEGRIRISGAPDEVIREEVLEEVYDVDLFVHQNPVTGTPEITVLSGSAPGKAGLKGKVHVICGGGSGEPLIRRLLVEGYEVTAGVLNRGDTDHTAAVSLGIEVVEELPFSPISSKSISSCKELIRRADVVIVSRLPFGWGNVANLELAREAKRLGKDVIVIGGIEGRDYTSDGSAAAIYSELLEMGARKVDTIHEALELLRKGEGDVEEA
jgi:iron complex transport system ATP-binding protein